MIVRRVIARIPHAELPQSTLVRARPVTPNPTACSTIFREQRHDIDAHLVRSHFEVALRLTLRLEIRLPIHFDPAPVRVDAIDIRGTNGINRSATLSSPARRGRIACAPFEVTANDATQIRAVAIDDLQPSRSVQKYSFRAGADSASRGNLDLIAAQRRGRFARCDLRYIVRPARSHAFVRSPASTARQARHGARFAQLPDCDTRAVSPDPDQGATFTQPRMPYGAAIRPITIPRSDVGIGGQAAGGDAAAARHARLTSIATVSDTLAPRSVQ